MTKPCTPDEIGKLKAQHLPKEVFHAVNELLAENFTCGSATILQKDIIARITEKLGGAETEAERNSLRRTIFDKGYLNFEEVYRDYGWKVSYDKPGYNESYDASFKFERAK